ncbi:protein D1 [Bicyclus anynana]|uniref:Protein D1 n=1 Tax=Bicyclus anynana TaxID=110368 RepID=A0A6J1MYS2_BICAN|nr:protein D1 [Bicyclus anynana]
MKLVFACLAVLFLASALAKPRRKKKQSIADTFVEAGFPEVLNIAAPENSFEVTYGPVRVNMGNEIYPGLTSDRPDIAWKNADRNALYAFIMLDPNLLLSAKEERGRTLLHALYVNIRNMDLDSADEVARFISPSPAPGSGVHDYVYLLYKHKKRIDTSASDIPDFSQPGYRILFNLTEFLSEYDFGDAEAGNFHRAQFPDDLEEACEEYCE